MENYYQSLGEASQQHQSLNEASASASSTLNEKLDREREALMLFGEPLVGHSIVENVVNLSKAGALKGAKALESRGIVPEGTTENIGRIASDFQEGGLKRVLKTQYNKQLNRVGNRGTVDNTPLPEDKAVELPDFEPQLNPNATIEDIKFGSDDGGKTLDFFVDGDIAAKTLRELVPNTYNGYRTVIVYSYVPDYELNDEDLL